MTDTLKLPVSDKHLRLAWRGINEALVYGDSNTSDVSSTSSMLTCVQWLSSMQDPILRYLAIQSYHIFESAQNMDYDLENVLNKSKEYRAILVECEEQILIEIKNLENSDGYDEEKHCFVTAHCNIIRDYQMIWHLAEIFFIKMSCRGFFIEDLQNWLNLQQPDVDMNYNSLIDEYNEAKGDIEIEINEKYWPTVISLSIHGRKKELSNLLACHTHTNSQAFRLVRETINMMPVFDTNYSENSIEFEANYTRWHQMTMDLKNSYLLDAYPELNILADILVGNKEIYFTPNMINITEGCWFYAIVGYLFYSQPLVNAKDISKCFKEFKREFKKSSSVLDGESTADLCSEEILNAIDSIFSLDLSEFVCNISKNCNSWWLCAHLIDLIEKINPHLFPCALEPINRSNSGIFDSELIKSELCSIREYFILHYAFGFVSHHSLVLMGLGYLHYCSTAGKPSIYQIIDHLELSTNKFATMIHSWCTKRRYDNIAVSICKRLSVASYKSGQIGNSLMWAIKGNDINFISRIADKLLRNLFDENNSNNFTLDLVDCLKDINIGIIGKKMTFVIKFVEILALINGDKFEEAARLFIHLIDSQLISRHFHLDVLLSVKPLLTKHDLFTADDIYKLFEVLQEVSQEDRQSEVNELREILTGELSLACLRFTK